MSAYDVKTRFPLPPEAPPDRPFPATAPWDTQISDLSGFWLEAHCTCGRSVAYPLRRMAADMGWELKLAEIVPKLTCKVCRIPFEAVWFSDDAAGDSGRHGAISKRHVLVGEG